MTTPADSIAKAEAFIMRALPAGWTKQFVEPPWKGLPPACRGCGKDPGAGPTAAQWANMTLVKRIDDREILLYSFGLACKTCVETPAVRERMAVAVFGPAVESLIASDAAGPAKPILGADGRPAR